MTTDGAEVQRQIMKAARLRGDVARVDVDEVRERVGRTAFGRRLRLISALATTVTLGVLAADAWFAYDVWFRG